MTGAMATLCLFVRVLGRVDSKVNLRPDGNSLTRSYTFSKTLICCISKPAIFGMSPPEMQGCKSHLSKPISYSKRSNMFAWLLIRTSGTAEHICYLVISHHTSIMQLFDPSLRSVGLLNVSSLSPVYIYWCQRRLTSCTMVCNDSRLEDFFMPRLGPTSPAGRGHRPPNVRRHASQALHRHGGTGGGMVRLLPRRKPIPVLLQPFKEVRFALSSLRTAPHSRQGIS